MNFDFSGGMAAATGYMQGRDQAVARDNLAEDRDYLKTQRTYQDQQQQRTVQQQQREDTERTSMQAIDPKAPQDVQMRAAAAAKRQSGDFKGSLELHDQADKVSIARAEKNVQSILAGAQGKSASQLATEAAAVLNADPVPGGIANIRDDGNGGVTMDVTDNVTGQTHQKQFANVQQTTEWLQAYKAPNVYAALQKMKQAAAFKAQEEANKPQKLSPGQILVNPATQQVLAKAPPPVGAEYVGDDANGDPMYRKMPVATAGGAGAGKGASKGNSGDVVADARAMLASAVEKSENKVTDDVRLRAEDNVGRLATQNPKVPPAMVARVALELAKDPSKAQPAIDPETGKIDLVYDDGLNGKIKVNVGIGDALNLQGMKTVVAQQLAAANGGKPVAPNVVEEETRKRMKGMTAAMLADFEPRNQIAYKGAAFDPAARNQLDTQLRAQAEAVVQQAGAGKSPAEQAAIRDRTEQALQQRMAALGKVLNLVRNYGDKPAGASQRAIAQPGGLASAARYVPPADSPAGRAASARQSAAAAADRAATEKVAARAELSAQFQRDAKAMAPLDLLRKYDDLRGQLPTADATTLKQMEQRL